MNHVQSTAQTNVCECFVFKKNRVDARLSLDGRVQQSGALMGFQGRTEGAKL